jgi:hypothetical protein
MLEGFDNAWTEVGSIQRLVTYTNLDPGRYVFRVTAANADGVWNEAGRAITLVVTPPWWATWWCRGLALVLSVGGACGLYAWRVNSLQRQQRVLEAEIVERKQVEEALHASQDSLRRSNAQIQSLAGRLITAHDEERRRIARELHDVTAQDLDAVAVNPAHLRRAVPDLPPEAQTLVMESGTLAAGVFQHILTLSYLLHPPRPGGRHARRGQWYPSGQYAEVRTGYPRHAPAGAQVWRHAGHSDGVTWHGDHRHRTRGRDMRHDSHSRGKMTMPLCVGAYGGSWKPMRTGMYAAKWRMAGKRSR